MNEGELCSICLEPMLSNIYHTKCNHKYHSKCFSEFLEFHHKNDNSQVKCPLCCQDIDLYDELHMVSFRKSLYFWTPCFVVLLLFSIPPLIIFCTSFLK